MRQASKKEPANAATRQPLSNFALAQTRIRLKRVAREIERATKHPQNPDTAHDLRVAIRRFTQCLRTFDDLLDPGPVKKMRKKLRRLMDLCGARRDYDVGLQVLAEAGLLADHPAFARFQEHRDHGMRALAHSLQRKQKWAVTDHWRKQLAARKRRPSVVDAAHSGAGVPLEDSGDARWIWSASVRDNAQRALPRLAEEFLQDGDLTAAAHGKPDLLHPFRLRAKRFRYTLEVFAPCYGGGFDAKIRELRGLQDRMGEINDCMVVLKLPGMNRAAAVAVRKLLAVRDATFRKYWSKTFPAAAGNPGNARSPTPIQPSPLTGKNRPLIPKRSPPTGFSAEPREHSAILVLMIRFLACFLFLCLCLFVSLPLPAQSLGNTGTIEGTVTDPSGASVANAEIMIHNLVTGYTQMAMADANGMFRLANLPPNRYHLEVKAPGFNQFSQDIEIRNAVPVQVKATLALASETTTVNVEGAAEAIEVDPSAHTDADRSLIQKLPSGAPGGGLSQAITYSTGGVAADANGFFHPVGDHAQVSYVIDGQPISDQQSKVFSTQLPTSAIQSMQLTTGTPNAEFGDKTSLVVQANTRSGLGAPHLFGNVDATYGTFGQTGGDVGLGFGTAKFGEFFAADGVRSGRFLDTPQFDPIHDAGNNGTIFDRLDYQPNGKDSFHMNFFAARNWTQIPNSLDQLSQDQKLRVLTWSIAPGYQHTLNAHTLLTVNPYIRKDQLNYYASREYAAADTPATQSQQRQLLNWGVKADVATAIGHNNIKYGIDLKQTRLLENFQFGVTDPSFNSPCIFNDGSGVGDPNLTNPNQCAALGFQPNIASNPNVTSTPFSFSLLPYDLSRGGRLFDFHDTGNINQAAIYIQDGLTLGNLEINMGLRVDYYSGLTTQTQPEPRLGLAYNIKRTGTVLRASYARTMETPFNENLLLSSATGAGGLAQTVFGSNSVPISPGWRNQFNTGFQQAIGKFIIVDADYFWKYTHNAFDFSTLLNTNLTFPISWHNSKLDGVTGRVSTTNLKGFQAYWTFGHTRARFFFPGGWRARPARHAAQWQCVSHRSR